ncbi:unnamed protein product [Amaranthus hypochondriacus]
MAASSSSSLDPEEIHTPSILPSSSSSSSPSPYEPEIDQEIWQACAGYLVDIPKLNSLVYYFPQEHMEHVLNYDNPNPNPNLNPNPNPNPICCGSFLCRVMNVSFLADPQTDQVFVKFLLQPCITDNSNPNPDPNPNPYPDPNPNPYPDPNRVFSCVKILSNITKYFYYVDTPLRENIFTRIPKNESQNIMLTDIHGNIWDIMLDSTNFFTCGWTEFVEAKNLTPGDAFVFIRKKSSNDGNDEYYIGIRKGVVNTGIRVEDIEDAIEKARNMESFEIVYYPLLGFPEFVVPKVKVDNAQRISWRCEMLVKFWHEFGVYGVPIKCRHTGTVLNIVHRENDVSNWPDSWWRVLQVEWHENPELLEDMPNLQNMSPWELQVYPSAQ